MDGAAAGCRRRVCGAAEVKPNNLRVPDLRPGDMGLNTGVKRGHERSPSRISLVFSTSAVRPQPTTYRLLYALVYAVTLH